MEDNITIVTSPNYFYGDQPSLMLFDVSGADIKLIIELIMEANLVMSLHLCYNGKSDREWLLNTARQCDRVIVNLENHTLIKGFILNHKNVSYYNSDNDITSLNTNELTDPLDYIMRFVNEQRQRQ